MSNIIIKYVKNNIKGSHLDHFIEVHIICNLCLGANSFFKMVIIISSITCFFCLKHIVLHVRSSDWLKQF